MMEIDQDEFMLLQRAFFKEKGFIVEDKQNGFVLRKA